MAFGGFDHNMLGWDSRYHGIWGSDGGQTLVGEAGHYLNSHIGLARGVLDLIRVHRDRLNHGST
jgi:hypothetical protein